MDMQRETEIIRLVLAGDRDLFAELINEHKNKVFALCLSLLRSKSSAEDAAQDVFIKAYTKLNKFRFEASFSTWLYRIAYRQCMDILNEQAKLKESAIEEDFEESQYNPVDAESRQLLETALAQLPEDYRHLLILKEGAQMSYEEIASSLGVSIEAVRGRLKRARSMLAQKARHFMTEKVSK